MTRTGTPHSCGNARGGSRVPFLEGTGLGPGSKPSSASSLPGAGAGVVSQLPQGSSSPLCQEVLSPLLPPGMCCLADSRTWGFLSLTVFAPVTFNPLTQASVASNKDAKCHSGLPFGAGCCGGAGCGWDPSRRGVGGDLAFPVSQVSIPRLTPGQRSILSYFVASPPLLPLSSLAVFPLLLGEPGKSPFGDQFTINRGVRQCTDFH